jgi:hypothetical protein
MLPVSSPNPTTLVIARRVTEGRRVVVSMNWRLVLPRETGLRMKGAGRSVRLGSFFPLLAWDGNDWALDPPTELPSADAWTTPTADFDVRVTHSTRLRLLASGEQVGHDRWRAKAVRDFTLALGRFTIVKGTAHVPAAVHVTVGVEPDPVAIPAGVISLALIYFIPAPPPLVRPSRNRRCTSPRIRLAMRERVSSPLRCRSATTTELRPADRSSESSAASPCRRSRCSTHPGPNRRSTSAS